MTHNLNTFSSCNPEELSDKELLERCCQLGNVAVKSRRMFIGLLPLVARRRVYDEKKFSSIFHFALMVGGVTYDTASEVLRLDTQLSELPLFRRALYGGEIGWSKIRAVLSLVTSVNEAQWLELLRALSRSALIVYVRDFRKQIRNEQNNLLSPLTMNTDDFQIEGNILQSSLLSQKHEFEADNFAGEITRLGNGGTISQPAEPELSTLQKLSLQREVLTLPVSADLAARLRLFRQKLEKKLKRLTTWQDVLEELLQNVSS